MKKNIYSDDKYKKWLKNAHPKTQDWFTKEVEYLSNNLKAGSKILDVGCGFGRHIFVLADKQKEVYGIDSFEGQIIRAKEYLSKFKNVFLSVQNVEDMNFSNNSFDYVICMTNTFGNLMEHKEKALKEMKRVCKKDGKIIISVYNDKALDVRKQDYEKAGVHMDIIDQGTVHLREGVVSEQFSKKQLEELFDKYSLKIKVIKLNEISFLCELIK